MDIQAIQDNIEILESSDTTPNNVAELACLYICQEHLKNSNLGYSRAFNEQFTEVLPAYSKYVTLKRNYQLGQGSEESMLESLSILCSEIKDLYASLYSSSDSRKERRILKESVESLNSTIK